MPFQKDGKQGVLGGTEFIAEAIDDLKPFRAGILEEEALRIGRDKESVVTGTADKHIITGRAGKFIIAVIADNRLGELRGRYGFMIGAKHPTMPVKNGVG